MGLSIHFKGRLKSKSSLPGLVEEVEDIAKIYKWEHVTHNCEFPPNAFGKREFNKLIYGISFTPPYCETVNLTFLSNGKLTSPWSLNYYLSSGDNTVLGGMSVKTHYAGDSVHKLLIHLLDHLQKKYFRAFTMRDEGQYWETRDEKLLEQNFTILNSLMKKLGRKLKTVPMNKDEKFETYFMRILKQIHSDNK